MSAKEMFEELNLEQIRNDDNYIEYVKSGLGGYISILFSLRWKTIKPTCGYQARGINYHEISQDELKAIICQAKELGWLEEEKKTEKNIEHYFEYLSKVGLGGFAVVNGRCTKCSGTRCSECDFSSFDCCNKRLRWLASPYRKPLYKLSQFEFDLIQTYRDGNTDCKLSARRILRELKDKGYFKCVDYDTKVKDILENCEVI